jgi:hypothetical protein
MNLNEKKKTINELKKFFNENIKDDIIIKEEDRMMYVDISCVVGFIPKTTNARDIIKTNFDVEELKIVNLEYSKENESKGCYSQEYLGYLLNFFNIFKDEKISIQTEKDMPMIIENKYFKVILAPRIDY